MIHQPQLVIGICIPRPIDLQRTRRLPTLGISQIHRDAAILALEFLHRIERRAVAQKPDRRVQTPAGDNQQRKPGPGLFVMDSDIAFFVERHGSSSRPKVTRAPKSQPAACGALLVSSSAQFPHRLNPPRQSAAPSPTNQGTAPDRKRNPAPRIAQKMATPRRTRRFRSTPPSPPAAQHSECQAVRPHHASKPMPAARPG